MEKKSIFVFVCGMLFAILFLIIASSISYNNQEIEYISSFNILENITSLNECVGLDLVNTSYCFNAYVSGFFNYTLDDFDLYDNDGELVTLNFTDLTFQKLNTTIEEHLRNNGGKCTEWSLYYKELCDSTDFECKIIDNDGIPGVFYGHQYFVMYDSNNYCKLDQMNIECDSNTHFKSGNYSEGDYLHSFTEKSLSSTE